MARGSRNHSTEPRSSDPTLSLYLLIYETTPNDEFTLTLTNPGLPIVPSSPFYRTLQDLWSQHGNRDATPSVGLIRAVAGDIQRQPRLWNFAIYRSWIDYDSSLHYVLLQSALNSNGSRGDGSVVGYLGLTPTSTSTRRGSPRRRNRFVRALEQGYLAEGSSEEN